jgi:hypothetical protein
VGSQDDSERCLYGRGERAKMTFWVGFDVGKTFHWLSVLDDAGEVVFSRRVEALHILSYWEWTTSNAPFLKGGTQTYASDASAVCGDDPKPREWLCGLAAGWRLSSLGRSRNYPRSTVRQRPVAGIYATTPR